MKKIFFAIVSILLLMSCDNSIDKVAEKQLRKTVLELAKNPETYTISNLRVVFKAANDSSIVLSYIGKGQNGFGGYSSSVYEYYYFIAEDGAYECVLDLDDNMSMSDKIKGTHEAFEGLGPEELSNAIDNILHCAVGITVMDKGRKIYNE